MLKTVKPNPKIIVDKDSIAEVNIVISRKVFL